MAFLEDKRWEEMDWLNKAIEPFTFSLNGVLARLPSEYVLHYMDVKESVTHDSHLRLDHFVNRMLSSIGASKEECELFSLLDQTLFYAIEIEPDTIINISKREIVGRISVVKQRDSLTDDEIKELLPVFNSYHELRIDRMSAKSPHINQLFEILECKEGNRAKSINKKTSILHHHITKVLSENTWNIKNVDLVIKLLKWIKSYAKNGDAYSLANISKLKCMTHKKNPIYSMEEVV